MSQVYDELAEIVADIRSWVSWNQLTGASALPRESVAPLTAEPARKSTPAPTAAPPKAAEAPRAIRVGQPSATSPSASEKTPPPSQPPSSPKHTQISAKWAALLDAPTTHTSSGPKDASLVIIRGAGSSSDAEAMLDRMLSNVLRVARGEVAIIDLVRDSRQPSDIGAGLRNNFGGYSPTVTLVMGTFAARALLGSEFSVQANRGEWVSDPLFGAVRVTHHPDGVLALVARGNGAVKREAFDDLKAVAQRLS